MPVIFLRNLVFFLSYWLVAGHFLRDGAHLPMAFFLLAPCGVFFKQLWLTRLLQVVLVISVFAVWLPTIIDIATVRMATEKPWGRMAVILTGVCLFSLFSAWAISPREKQKFEIAAGSE